MQWPFTGGANFAVNPVNSADVVITSSVGRIFTTQNNGVTWFDVGEPTVFGSPGSFSNALAYGMPDPAAPEGVGNLGNFIYVGTQTGQIYVTQDGGGNGTSNNWLPINLGLSGGAVESITTDPIRGTHDAYAVTAGGVFYIKDSIALANNPTNTADEWINITGIGANNLHNLPFTIFGQTYNPLTDPNAVKLNQGMALSSIIADWRYMIPNAATDPAGPGFHPVLYVGSNSGVYQSTDDGMTWSLFPNNATYAANTVAQGGDLSHVAVTSLSLSLGNIDANTGMPNLAGPYDPLNPSATPDPDLLMAATYGQGEFAINLAPLILNNAVSLDSSSGSLGNVTTAQPEFDGLSEITKFSNATRITIVDDTPGDATFGKVIGGFDPANAAGTNIAANWTNALGNFSVAVNKGVFTSNGKYTVEVYATDDAGSMGNKVMVSFTLNVPGLTPPEPPVTPTLELAPYDVTGAGIDVHEHRYAQFH